MYIIIFLVVISSLTTMILAFQLEKDKGSESKKYISLWQVYVSSILMGALGGMFSIIGFNFEIKNKKFVISQVVLLIIQAVIIVFIYRYLK